MFTPHPSVFKYLKFCPSQAWWFSKITKYSKGFFKPHLSVFTYFQIPSKPILAVSQDLPRLSHSPQTKPLGFEVFSNSFQANPGGFTKCSSIFRSCSNQAPRFSNMFKLRASQPWRFYKIFLFPIMFKPSSPIFKCLNSVQANPGGFRRFSKMFQFCANHTPRFSDLSEFCSSHGGSKRFPRFPNCLQTTHLGLEILSNSVRANHGGSQGFSNIFHSVQTKPFCSNQVIRASMKWRVPSLNFRANIIPICIRALTAHLPRR